MDYVMSHLWVIFVPIFALQSFAAVMAYLMGKWQHHGIKPMLITLIPVAGLLFFAVYGTLMTMRFLKADHAPAPAENA